jgi:hypothetical protein
MYEVGDMVLLNDINAEDVGMPEAALENMKNSCHKIERIDDNWYVRINGWFFTLKDIKRKITPEEYPEYFI